MRHAAAFAAMAATLSMAGAAIAQTPPSAKPTAPTTGAPATAQPSDAPASAAPSSSTPSTSGAPPAASTSGANASANAGLTSGMSVKDKTGALIGEVKAVKDGVATIQMGSDTFNVDSNKLGVSGGAATINATQAELKAMMPKK